MNHIGNDCFSTKITLVICYTKHNCSACLITISSEQSIAQTEREMKRSFRFYSSFSFLFAVNFLLAVQWLWISDELKYAIIEFNVLPKLSNLRCWAFKHRWKAQQSFNWPFTNCCYMPIVQYTYVKTVESNDCQNIYSYARQLDLIESATDLIFVKEMFMITLYLFLTPRLIC